MPYHSQSTQCLFFPIPFLVYSQLQKQLEPSATASASARPTATKTSENTCVCVYVCRSVCVCELPCNDTTNTQGSNRMRRFTDFRKPISVFTAKYFYFLISDDVFLLFFIRFSSLGPPFCMFAFAVHFSFVLHFVHFHVSDVSPLCVCVVSRVRAHDTRCSPLN